MAHISKTILEVMNNIKDQEYILPDIQRGLCMENGTNRKFI